MWLENVDCLILARKYVTSRSYSFMVQKILKSIVELNNIECHEHDTQLWQRERLKQYKRES